jgi:phage tail protein X
VFLGQRLQHLFPALASTDFLPPSPVESRLVAIDSGHTLSPGHTGLLTQKNRGAADLRGHAYGEVAGLVKTRLPANRQADSSAEPFHEAGVLELPDMTSGVSVRHVSRLSGNFSIAKAQRAV